MSHITKDKGDLAVYKTMLDLTIKGYDIFTSVSEHLHFDLIACKGNKLYRIQVKYSAGGNIRKKTSWQDKNGNHTRMYEAYDFDYYAIYLPNKDVVVYPSISYRGAKITTELPMNAKPFYWYEDFLDLTQTATKKTFRDFDITLVSSKSPRLEQRKILRPSKEELEKLVWDEPTSQIAKRLAKLNDCFTLECSSTHSE
jgi:hypothetical protein